MRVSGSKVRAEVIGVDEIDLDKYIMKQNSQDRVDCYFLSAFQPLLIYFVFFAHSQFAVQLLECHVSFLQTVICNDNYKLSQTKGLKKWEFILSVLEPRNPKSKCWQVCLPSKGLREVPLHLLQLLGSSGQPLA